MTLGKQIINCSITDQLILKALTRSQLAVLAPLAPLALLALLAERNRSNITGWVMMPIFNNTSSYRHMPLFRAQNPNWSMLHLRDIYLTRSKNLVLLVISNGAR